MSIKLNTLIYLEKNLIIWTVLSKFAVMMSTALRNSKWLERDSHMMEILVAIIETSHCTIPMTKPGPKQKVKDIPGWKQYVEPFRSDAMFWHSIWLSSGKPNT